jgi:hypothetical protein
MWGAGTAMTADADKLLASLSDLRRSFARGDLQNARNICEAVFARHPDYRDEYGHPVYVKEALRLALRDRDLARARQMAEQLRGLVPSSDPVEHVLFGRHYVAVGNRTAARIEWRAALAMLPTLAEAQAAIAALESEPSRTPLAVVTMVYDEADFLPIWLSHYGRQVGLENCFIIDHGSDDGSTEGLRIGGVIRLKRSQFDERQRCAMIADICSGLLQYYESVAYVDVDEFLVADPDVAPGLVEYARTALVDVTTALGVNLVHLLGHESQLDLSRPILRQRAWMAAFGSMCKPNLIRRRVQWSPGFHTYDGPVEFGSLFNFHLAYVDLPLALRRQEKRRRAVQDHPRKDHHHKESDIWVRSLLEGWSRFARIEPTLRQDCPERTAFEQRIVASQVGRENDTYRIDLGVRANQLWKVPARMRDVF